VGGIILESAAHTLSSFNHFDQSGNRSEVENTLNVFSLAVSTRVQFIISLKAIKHGQAVLLSSTENIVSSFPFCRECWARV